MAIEDKVVWSEGVFICPQHFQQFERYVESIDRHSMHVLQGYYWGWTQLEVERSGLKAGQIGIRQAEGVFPDGTLFSLNEKVCGQLSLIVPAHTQDMTVCLAWPRASLSTDEVQHDDVASGHKRYKEVLKDLHDSSNVSLGTRSVALGQSNPVLLLSKDVTDAYLSLPIAYIKHCSADQAVVLDEGFIPPVLNSQGCAPLSTYISEINGLLRQKGHAMAEHLNDPGAGGSAEVRDFLMLQVINRYSVYVQHEHEGARQTHPEQLFVNLSKLCADLMTFTPSKKAEGFPVYEHNNLQMCFATLVAYLRRTLSVMIEQRAIRIPLELRDEATRVAQTPDVSLLASASFVLAIKADMPSEVLRQRIPSVMKISTVDKVRDLVAYHLPGVKVNTLSVVPRELPYHSGYSYFELDKQTEMWDMFDVSSGMAIHLAGDFPNLDVEFWAIKP
ncbi:MAG: type VI secretion system baseplate subunit TssK [Neisseriaceae bacterium]|nr:type VI secretion system baseplate subunit TssK [Neisseriaceae bacterium]